jgi:hypothetical protein
VPYIRFVPRQIQKLFFGSLGGFQAITGWIFLPMRWGESILVIARNSKEVVSKVEHEASK